MDVQQALASFLTHGQSVRNLSDRTIRAYQSDLAQFLSRVGTNGMVGVTEADLEQYVETLGSGPYRDTSIRRKVAALKVFFRYLEDTGVVTNSPAKKLKIKRPAESRVPVVLSARELKLLLSAPKRQIEELEGQRDMTVGARNRYFCAVRDNLIIELLFSTGIRIGELVALDLGDIDLPNRQIRITGRNTRGRYIPMSAEGVIEALRQYLELRNERPLNTQALFVGRSGTRLTIYSIENIFKKHVRMADIKRHITPHSLRHTMAAMLIHGGADIRDVQEMLGHASILSTQIYTKVSPARRGRAPKPRVFATPGAARLPIK